MTHESPEATGDSNWRSRISWFLFGQTVSLFGSSLVQYAILWYITLTTKSGMVMTLYTLCGFLPQIVISLFAGVWADRFSRKMLIMLSDSAIALSTLVLIVVMLSGYQELWLLLLVSAIRSAGAGIQTPAVNALIPQLAPADKLMRVSGVNGTLQSLTLLLSPAVAGAILTAANMNLTAVLLVDVATAAAGVGIMAFLKVPRLRRETAPESPLRELAGSLRYMVTHRFLRSLLLVYALLMFLITPASVLTPLLVAHIFGDEVWRQTMNEMAFSGGAVAGGLLIAAWGGFRNRIHTIVLAGVVFGGLTVALGLVTNFVWYLAVMAVVGVSMPFFNSPSIVLLQEKVQPEMQGRVFSFVQIVASAAMPLGMLLFGPLADLPGGVRLLLITTGAGIVLLTLSMLLVRPLVDNGLPPAESPPPAE